MPITIRAVLDVQNEVAVHAVAGLRHAYQPILNQQGQALAPSASVAAMIQSYGIRDFYLADLDAIDGRPVHWQELTLVADQVDSLWFDVGIQGHDRLTEACEFIASTDCDLVAVLALESLPSRDFIAAAVQRVANHGEGQLAFSLDLRNGAPVTKLAGYLSATPREIAEQAIDGGVRKFVVLDLAAVGRATGCPTIALCREIRELANARNLPVEIATGGGIRGPDDITLLKEAGCSQALIATALKLFAKS